MDSLSHHQWVIKGLHNRRIDCYMLAVLQFLYGMDEFPEKLMPHTKCECTDPEKPVCKACVVKEILAEYITAKGSSFWISPHLLDQIQVKINEECDPCELFLALSQAKGIDEILNSMINFQFISTVCFSFVHSFLFFIKKRSSIQLVCGSCGYETRVNGLNSLLVLPMAAGATDVQSLMDAYATEVVTGDYYWALTLCN